MDASDKMPTLQNINKAHLTMARLYDDFTRSHKTDDCLLCKASGMDIWFGGVFFGAVLGLFVFLTVMFFFELVIQPLLIFKFCSDQTYSENDFFGL